ncbi:unnamed protein product, partial [Owenia fusiformis]
ALYGSASLALLAKLDKLHYQAGVICAGVLHGSDTSKVFQCLNWKTLSQRRNEKNVRIMFKINKRNVAQYICDIFDKYKNPATRLLRHSMPYNIPTNVSIRLLKAPVLNIIKQWNNLSQLIRELPTISSFKNAVRSTILPNINFIPTTKLNLTRSNEKILNRLRVDFFLKEHFFSHNFIGVTDNKCPCGSPENTKHFLLSCPRHTDDRTNMITALRQNNLLYDENIYTNRNDQVKYLLYENTLSRDSQNLLLNIVLNFVRSCYIYPLRI